MTLFIETLGQGEDVVLLHGWGMNRCIWQPIAAGLAEHYCVHSVDLPGYGESAAVHPYEVMHLTQAISAQFPFPVHFIGWSLGGLLGMQWALNNPATIKSLTLVASSPCFVQKADWAFATSLKDLDRFATYLLEDYRSVIKRFLALQMLGGEINPQMVRALETRLFKFQAPEPFILLESLKILKKTDLRSQVSQITCPVLLQYGAKDLMTPLQVGEWLAVNLSDAKLVVHPKAAHLPFLSHGTDFLAAQNNFLRAV